MTDEARHLAIRVDQSVTEIIRWLLLTVRLDQSKPRMQSIFEARDDALNLKNQREHLKVKAVELHTRGGWSHEPLVVDVLDLHDNLLEMLIVLRAAEEALSALVRKFVRGDGRRFDYEREWHWERRQVLWDGIDRFRSQVKRLHSPPHGRTTTTTKYYKVR